MTLNLKHEKFSRMSYNWLCNSQRRGALTLFFDVGPFPELISSRGVENKANFGELAGAPEYEVAYVLKILREYRHRQGNDVSRPGAV